eukprot:GGOE01045119.1.p2 GENE.GGOE01045119.1~~GGOE01045119.1.p2  ORF type:complete len:110 (-),score=19.50 GGOE01045119.1:13-342(-)
MGAAVGCAAAWHLPGDGEAGRWGLLHSMTLTPTLHGSGLAKPLLSNALGLMRHFHNGCALQTEGHRLAYRSSHLCSNSKPHVSATQCTSQINAYAHWAYDNATSIELDD